MTPGDISVTLRIDDQLSAKLPGMIRDAMLAAGQQDQTVPAALLGAAAAAVLLPKPVSRRRLLFPWLAGRDA